MYQEYFFKFKMMGDKMFIGYKDFQVSMALYRTTRDRAFYSRFKS